MKFGSFAATSEAICYLPWGRFLVARGFKSNAADNYNADHATEVLVRCFNSSNSLLLTILRLLKKSFEGIREVGTHRIVIE